MMNDFLKFYDKVANNYGFNLKIYQSSIMDWCIDIGYKCTHVKHNGGKSFIEIQNCDMEYAFAQAQVELKDYMLKEYEGY